MITPSVSHAIAPLCLSPASITIAIESAFLPVVVATPTIVLFPAASIPDYLISRALHPVIPCFEQLYILLCTNCCCFFFQRLIQAEHVACVAIAIKSWRIANIISTLAGPTTAPRYRLPSQKSRSWTVVGCC